MTTSYFFMIYISREGGYIFGIMYRSDSICLGRFEHCSPIWESHLGEPFGRAIWESHLGEPFAVQSCTVASHFHTLRTIEILDIFHTSIVMTEASS